MKRTLCILLTCMLAAGMLTGCDRAPSSNPESEAPQEVVNFAPETTAVAPAENAVAPAYTEAAAQEQQPVAQDSAATAEPLPSQQPADAPAANSSVNPLIPTPQPNAHVSSYSEVSNTGLGFRFNYPTGWNNIPGRSTICYVQPLDNGTVYPARVAVTMKQVPHKAGEKTMRAELVEYLKLLMSHYDESTFEVSEELDTSTRFMGNKAMSTTYLAYDGDQEIQGYVIITCFEKYLFCYHFQCAYADYNALESAMRTMRDSVQAEQLNISEDE